MSRNIQRLGDSERGTSVIEFALAAPFMAALLVGVIDLSKAYSDRLELEQAAQRTIELVQQQRSVSSDYSVLADEAAAAAGIRKTSSNPAVNQWLECSSDGGATWVSQGNNTITSQCPNDTDLPARYVTISIQKGFTPVLRSAWLGTDSNGQYMLTGRAGIRVQ